MHVYRDPRTGQLKAPRFAATRDSRWGELNWDEHNSTWSLVKRNSDGERVVIRTGRLTSSLTEVRAQELLERIQVGNRRKERKLI